MTLLSTCCAAPVTVKGGATQWWQCTRCGWSCDAQPDNREPAYTPRHAAPPRHCMHCMRDLQPSREHPGKWADSDGITVCMVAEYGSALPTGVIDHKPMPEPT